jgi:hypothetical protein
MIDHAQERFMRRIIFGLLMLWAALFGACQASAQFNGCAPGFCNPQVVSAPSGPTWTANSTAHNPPAQNLSFSTDDVCFPSSTPPCTTTFNLNFGAPLSTDLIIVVVADNSALSRTVKVNGTTCTQIGIDPQDRSGLYQCTGISTAAINIEVSAPGGAYQYLAVAVGVLHGLTSSTATATGGNCAVAEPDPQVLQTGCGGTPTTASITVPSSGFGILEVGSSQQSVTVDGGSSPWTLDSTVAFTSGFQITLGHTGTAGSWSPGIDGLSFSSPGMIAAAWH